MKINEAKDLLKSLLETARSIVKFSFFFFLALKKKKRRAVITTVRTNVKRMQRYTPLWTWGGGGNPEQF